ncbi:hypothetical protein GWK08_17285 [Leptobacterium flavescens]|uniref:Uncharacterized protein n=1 Tax=Leptobacterium flavescens TaxID=472055 RepID=A0A6P0UWU7_9FLAO|nr:hypothetical protein [Leptobacterium flavescens]NER15213.1 hypothetical protein [Leptobacterium flavescens]
MRIDNHQLSAIKTFLKNEGVTNVQLRDDLTDHFGCVIEECMRDGKAFEDAFYMARDRIAPDGALQIEKDLNYLLTVNREIMIRKIVFIMGYFSAYTIILSIALYLPGILDANTSGLVAMAGMLLFSISVLPFYFYLWYKKSIHQFKEA